MHPATRTVPPSCDAVEKLERGPMQIALECEDILREVFGNFEEIGDADVDRRTLAVLALVSKDFSNVALDLLWSTLYTVFPLLKLLERTLLLQETCGGSPCCCPKSVEPISDEEWNRFVTYARRVRTLHLMQYLANINHSGLISLFFRANGKPVFTSLHTLELNFSSAAVEILYAFLTTSTNGLSALSLAQVLEASRNPFDAFVKYLVPAVQANSPVSELILEGALNPFILEIPLRLSGLRKLIVFCAIPFHYLEAFSGIDGLRELMIQIEPTELPSSIPPSTFKDLRALAVSGFIVQVEWLLEHICAPMVNKVIVDLSVTPSTWKHGNPAAC